MVETRRMSGRGKQAGSRGSGGGGTEGERTKKRSRSEAQAGRARGGPAPAGGSGSGSPKAPQGGSVPQTGGVGARAATYKTAQEGVEHLDKLKDELAQAVRTWNFCGNEGI